MTSRKTPSRFSRSSKNKKPTAGSLRKAKNPREVSVAEVKDDFSRYLRMAESDEILITRHGRPAGVLIGFANEDDWFEYRLENDPRFLQRVAEARAAFRRGEGTPIEEIEVADEE